MASSRRIFLKGPHLNKPIPVNITPADKIGSGSFAIVFRKKITNTQERALKIWKKMDNAMAKKIAYLVAQQQNWHLPTNTYPSLEEIVDENNDTIGMSMNLMNPEAEELGRLFNRRQWISLGMDHQKVAKLFHRGFLDLEQIGAHFVILDISSRNVPFVPSLLQPEWIDFDSWRVIGKNFGEPFVITPDFVDPLLINPHFKAVASLPEPQPSNTLAMFARLFCRAFFGVDVYGGTHSSIIKNEDRIEGRIWFLDTQVSLPSFAAHPYQATDEVLDALQRTFVQDKRDVLNPAIFEHLVQKLKKCSVCGNFHSRSTCPICTKAIPQIAPILLDTVTVKELLKSVDTIVSASFRGGILTTIAIENAEFVIYRRGKDGEAVRIPLFPFESGLKFEFVSSNYVAVNKYPSTTIDVWQIDNDQAQLHHKTTSEPYNSNGGRVPFRGSNGGLMRLVRRSLTRHAPEFGDVFLDRSLPTQVSENQTWFWSHPDKDVHFVYMNILLDPEVLQEKQEYQLLVNGSRLDLTDYIPNFNQGELLVGSTVCFGNNSLLLRQTTKENGEEYIRTFIIGYDGNLQSLPNDVSRMLKRNHPIPDSKGVAYTDVDEYGNNSTPYLWVATDEGVGQQNVLTGKMSTLNPTNGAVTAQDDIINLMSKGGKRHWLVIKPASITYLIFNT